MGIFEIIVILAIALIVVGPEGLPDLLKTVGKVLRDLRAASNTVMREISEATDEPRRALRELNPLEPNSGSGRLQPRKSEQDTQNGSLEVSEAPIDTVEVDSGVNHSDSTPKPEEPPHQQ